MALALGVIGAFIAAFVAWVFLAGPWRNADMNAGLAAPLPLVLGAFAGEPPITTPDAWRARRLQLKAAFERHIYGAAPAPVTPTVTHKTPIAPEHAGGVIGVEQWRVELGAAGHFHLVVVRPPSEAPTPLILTLDFCGNRAAFLGRPAAIAPPAGYVQWYCRTGLLDLPFKAIFGPHINGPPFAEVTARGYAVAMLYAGDVVPDGAAAAREALARFAPHDTGALMAWAWTASRALDVLAEDARFDPRRIALFGQSRQGKTALLAGAFDERFAAIIALQAGRGGDAPRHGVAGEGVKHMRRTFPHWFAPRFAEPGPVDAQHLIALVAPRHVLFGHAKRDEWADPAGAREARAAAGVVWDLLAAPPPSAFTRAGGHGIHARDWTETLRFLDARMRA